MTNNYKKQSPGEVLCRRMFLKISQNSKKSIRSHFLNKVVCWKPETVRSSHWRGSVNQGVLKNVVNFTEKNLCWKLFLINLQLWGRATLLKKTLALALSCEICKLLKNNYFEEHLWMSPSKRYLKRHSNTDVFLWILWIIQEHLFCRGSTNGWFWNTSVGVSLNKVASLTAWRSSARERL